MPEVPVTAGGEEIRVSVPQWELLQGKLERLEVEVGKQRASLASYERRVAEIEERLSRLGGAVGSQWSVVATVQELCTLLARDDDAWQTANSLLSTSSVSTKGVLHQFVAEKVGRPRPLHYIRQ